MARLLHVHCLRSTTGEHWLRHAALGDLALDKRSKDRGWQTLLPSALAHDGLLHDRRHLARELSRASCRELAPKMADCTACMHWLHVLGDCPPVQDDPPPVQDDPPPCPWGAHACRSDAKRTVLGVVRSCRAIGMGPL